MIVVVFMKYDLFCKSKFSEPQFNFLIAYSFSRFLHHIGTDATSTDNFNGYDRGCYGNLTWKNWISCFVKMMSFLGSIIVSTPRTPKTRFLLSFNGIAIKDPDLACGKTKQISLYCCFMADNDYDKSGVH